MSDGIISLTVDSPLELRHALAKTAQLAKDEGSIVYLCSNGLLFYASYCFPAEGMETVAKCYPGGRNILFRNTGL